MASEAVLLKSFRERIAAHMAGENSLKPIGFMAFGDGGHDKETGKPISPSESQTALRHEVLRKAVSSVVQEDTLSATGKGVIENNELIDVELSEAALCDTDGNLIGIKTFAPKVKEADERYTIQIRLHF